MGLIDASHRARFEHCFSGEGTGAELTPKAEDWRRELVARIDVAGDLVIRGGGHSDVLFEKKLQVNLSAILHAVPEGEREQTELAIREAGWDPDYQTYVPGEGECELTGIDIECCPSGRHD